MGPSTYNAGKQTDGFVNIFHEHAIVYLEVSR
jgi:hypothetical protein